MARDKAEAVKWYRKAAEQCDADAQFFLGSSTGPGPEVATAGEPLVLYWLSKYGLECALVDHTGIDIIVRNPRLDVSL